jgi:CubicO group peptidase (beta-lactamase class C family)
MLVPAFAGGASRESFDAFVRAVMKKGRIPGVAVAVLERGRVAWARGYGFANLERQIPMAPDSVLNIGSVTKTITATAIMQLWENGRLELDGDINRVLPFAVRNPAFPSLPITTRHLLTHTSSIDDAAEYDESYACGDPTTPLAVWVERYLRAKGHEAHFTRARPGTSYDYTNVGFGLLGVLIEAVSKQSYADYTIEHIFHPLGMSSTSWYLAHTDRARHAIPYEYVARGAAQVGRVQDPRWSPGDHRTPTFVPHCLYSFPTLPDGLARTSVNDLCRFVAAYQLGGALDGKRVLRPETVRAILTAQPIAHKPKGFEQGLAWFSGESTWGHSGGDPGIVSEIAMRADGLGVVLLANSSSEEALAIAHRLLTAKAG